MALLSMFHAAARRLPGACLARWRAAGLALATALGTALGSSAAAAQPADCPPPLQLPSAEQTQQLAAQARDRGVLWRLDKDGRSLWLYGTLHLGQPGWLFPGPTVAAALAAAEVLALEVDLSDPAVARATAQGMAALPQPPALPAGLAPRLAALAAADCVQDPGFARQHPLLQALALTVSAARRDGLEPGFAQEVALTLQARRNGQAIVSLERPAEQLGALVPATPRELVPMIDSLVTQLESGRLRQQLGRLAQLWSDGDLATLGRYGDWCGCADTDEDRLLLQRLNDARNPALAARIAALHGQGRSVFAAVGALHMTGPQALPLLLAQQGFAVTPLLPAP